MRYRGPVENFEDLPTTGKIGDTYKVSKEFNISIGGTTIDLKVGDLLILNGTEEDGIVKNISWDRIESGESADTTYTLSSAEDDTNILLSDSHGNIQNYEIRSAGPIEVTNRLGKDNNTNPGIDIEHSVVVEDKEKVEPTNTSTSTNYGSTFKIVSDVVANKYGHVTEIKTQDITLPNLIRDVIVADSSNNSLIFKDGESNKQGSLKLVSGKNTSISSDSNNSDLEVTISHETITSKNLSENNAPKHGETFTAIASLMVDNGHVTEITTSDITLPTETTYSIEGPTQDANGIQWELKDSEENNKGIIKMISDTLNISVENESAKVEMVWGEF